MQSTPVRTTSSAERRWLLILRACTTGPAFQQCCWLPAALLQVRSAGSPDLQPCLGAPSIGLLNKNRAASGRCHGRPNHLLLTTGEAGSRDRCCATSEVQFINWTRL